MDKQADTRMNTQTVLGTCPSAAALRQVSGRWSLEVVAALRAGPLRNHALLRQLRGVSPKVLAETLRGLVHSGLVVRTEFDAPARHVEYALTAQGLALTAALAALDAWALDRAD